MLLYHLPLPSQAKQQEAGLEAEQLGFAPMLQYGVLECKQGLTNLLQCQLFSSSLSPTMRNRLIFFSISSLKRHCCFKPVI